MNCVPFHCQASVPRVSTPVGEALEKSEITAVEPSLTENSRGLLVAVRVTVVVGLPLYVPENEKPGVV